MNGYTGYGAATYGNYGERVDTCARCERRAIVLDFCARHYDEFLGEWACACGGAVNDDTARKCAACGQARTY